MEIQKSEKIGLDLKQKTDDIIDFVAETVGVAASPSLLWLLVLLNSLGITPGFSGHVTMPENVGRNLVT